jgi:hypothetical protein
MHEVHHLPYKTKNPPAVAMVGGRWSAADNDIVGLGN